MPVVFNGVATRERERESRDTYVTCDYAPSDDEKVHISIENEF